MSTETPAGPERGHAVSSVEPGDILSRALDIYRAQAPTLLIAAVIVFAIQALLTIVLGLLGALIGVILNYFFTGMVVRLVEDVQDGRRDSSLADLFKSVTPV